MISYLRNILASPTVKWSFETISYSRWHCWIRRPLCLIRIVIASSGLRQTFFLLIDWVSLCRGFLYSFISRVLYYHCSLQLAGAGIFLRTDLRFLKMDFVLTLTVISPCWSMFRPSAMICGPRAQRPLWTRRGIYVRNRYALCPKALFVISFTSGVIHLTTRITFVPTALARIPARAGLSGLFIRH